MIPRPKAQEAIQEIVNAGLSYMPQDPERIKAELKFRIDALAHYAKSEAHAQRVVSWLTEHCAEWPTPAAIVEACAFVEDPASSAAVSRARGCPYCHGDGFVSIDGEFGLSAAVPCDHTGHRRANLGPAMTAAQAKRYSQEKREAKRRKQEWIKRRVGRTAKDTGFPAIDRADVEKIISEADIEREVERLHAEKLARAETGAGSEAQGGAR